MVEVLVLLGIVGLLLLILVVLLPSGNGPSRGSAYKVKCASNLREIGRSMRQYALDYDGQFPRTRYDPVDPTPRFFTGVMSSEPFAEGGPAANDVTAAWWHLLRESDMAAEVFICPTDAAAVPMGFAPGKSKRDYANFAGRRYLSYSFANPYPSREAAEAGFAWSNRLPSTFVLAGDVNSGVPGVLTISPSSIKREFRPVNSPNHGLDGQHLLYADGAVRFEQSPFDPVSKDNVYAAAGSEAIISPPLAKHDTVLLPTADATAVVLGTDVRDFDEEEAASRRFRNWVLVPGLLVGAALIAAVAIWAGRARRRKLERG